MSSHSFFFTSPFALTASRDTAECWAGREDVLLRVQKLQSSFTNRADSSLDLVWANLGAGKSHLLYHFSYRLLNSESATSRPVVAIVELPQHLRGFHELYSRIIRSLDLSFLAQLLIQYPPCPTSHNLNRAARALHFGGAQERELAESWLLGGRPHLSSLKASTGISSRLEDDRAAADIFQLLLQCFATANIRFVLMADEFQRISTMKPQLKESLLAIIRSFFSQTPQYFSLILAAAYRLEQSATDSLTPELRTLLGPRPTITLPAMDASEAVDFVRKRFEFFRPKEYSGNSFAPFDEHGVAAVIRILQERDLALIPRELLQAMAFCYDEFFESLDKPIGAERVNAALASKSAL